MQEVNHLQNITSTYKYLYPQVDSDNNVTNVSTDAKLDIELGLMEVKPSAPINNAPENPELAKEEIPAKKEIVEKAPEPDVPEPPKNSQEFLLCGKPIAEFNWVPIVTGFILLALLYLITFSILISRDVANRAEIGSLQDKLAAESARFTADLERLASMINQQSGEPNVTHTHTYTPSFGSIERTLACTFPQNLANSYLRYDDEYYIMLHYYNRGDMRIGATYDVSIGDFPKVIYMPCYEDLQLISNYGMTCNLSATNYTVQNCTRRKNDIRMSDQNIVTVWNLALKTGAMLGKPGSYSQYPTDDPVSAIVYEKGKFYIKGACNNQAISVIGITRDGWINPAIVAEPEPDLWNWSQGKQLREYLSTGSLN